MVSVPGVPDVPPGGADLEWSKKWRGSIYGTIDQQKLVARACLVEELPPSPSKMPRPCCLSFSQYPSYLPQSAQVKVPHPCLVNLPSPGLSPDQEPSPL